MLRGKQSEGERRTSGKRGRKKWALGAPSVTCWQLPPQTFLLFLFFSLMPIKELVDNFYFLLSLRQFSQVVGQWPRKSNFDS